ncbi:hypothetical protein SDC9_133398 [bioreactor metagenome]|uniref:Uncharacterized protein n=1 Tax=bioreactor metagenome TaxID=1076179 RepID=A0A645DAT4_9ZZZZ
MRPKTVSDRALRFFGRRNLIESDWEDAHEAAENYKKWGTRRDRTCLSLRVRPIAELRLRDGLFALRLVGTAA